MQILDAEEEAAEVESCSGVIANADIGQKIKEIASFDVFKQQINEVSVFIAVDKLYDEGVITYRQYLFFAF